jgi:recombination protein RecT
VQNGELHLPANYSPGNALRSAWLILQSKVDKDKNFVLLVCTRESIHLALLDMVIQGLNPQKNQGYFIAYGNKLSWQRSYFGDEAIVKEYLGACDVDAQVIWEGDGIEYDIVRGKKQNIKHKQKFSSINKNPQGAYCIVTFPDGREVTDLMTIEQIHKSWSMSKNFPFSDNGELKPLSTHAKFPEEMAKRTVLHRTCKPIIASSSDKYLLLKQSIARSEEIASESDFREEIAANANNEVIDIQTGEVIEVTKALEAPKERIAIEIPVKQPEPELVSDGSKGSAGEADLGW